MIRSLLMLSSGLAVIASGLPATAQTTSETYSSQGGSAFVSASRQEETYGGAYAEQSGDNTQHAERSYGARSYEQGSSEDRAFEAQSEQSQSYQSSYQSGSYGSGRYQTGDYETERRASYVHRTTDSSGFLSWAGKVDDGAGYEHGDRRWQGADARGGGCPVGHGERVLSCRYIPFEPVVREQPLVISDEDFAYEGSVGPMVAPDGGGGGGGGGGSSAEAGGSAFASASASASASVSVSGSINIHGHFGGHYGGGGWGHMGGHYGGGGYHGGGGGWGHMGGGGHMKSGCGCSKK